MLVHSFIDKLYIYIYIYIYLTRWTKQEIQIITGYNSFHWSTTERIELYADMTMLDTITQDRSDTKKIIKI